MLARETCPRSVFAEEAFPCGFIDRKVGPDEECVWLAGGVLPDERHGTRAASIGSRSRGEVHRSHPLVKGMHPVPA